MKDPLAIVLVALAAVTATGLGLFAWYDETTPRPTPIVRCAAWCRGGEVAGWTVDARGGVQCFCNAPADGGAP